MAVDCVIGGDNYFHSATNEDHPWLQIHIPTQATIKAVTLVNRGVRAKRSVGGEELQNVEVRAGSSPLPPGHSGPITINTVCGTFAGPGVTGENHTITCNTPIVDADYVTVQIMEIGTLTLNEVLLETVGKYRIVMKCWLFSMKDGKEH